MYRSTLREKVAENVDIRARGSKVLNILVRKEGWIAGRKIFQEKLG
jgi:hypothetical protein